MKVKKREGQIVEFEPIKIENAIKKAFASVNKEYNKIVLDEILYILNDFGNGYVADVERIQDTVENKLMELGHYDVAKSFILYREKRSEVREWAQKKQNFIQRYKGSSNTANATIDDNSNVGGKNIGILNSEIHKEDNILISRAMVTEKLKELYPNFNYKSYCDDLQRHIIYKNDESSFAGAISPYCCSISMYPFLTGGIKGIGGLSAAPKNLDSFCGMYINLIFAVSSMFAGAVATSEVLLYFDYFSRKEWGDDYYKHVDSVITTGKCARQKTIRKQIHQYWQQIIYSINQPAAARGMQSAFVNFSYFDKPFFDGMFGDFYFPDGTKPQWDSLNWLQKEFMQWFNKERLRCMLTFPVESFALVYQNGKFVDEESAKFVAEEYARGHSFFTYISDTVDSLSSCCFEGNENIWVKNVKTNNVFVTPIEDFVNSIDNSLIPSGMKIGDGYKIDSFNKEKNLFEETDITGILKKSYTGFMYKIFVDGKEIKITSDHKILVFDAIEKRVEEISASDLFDDYKDKLVGIKGDYGIEYAEVEMVDRYYVFNKPVYDIELKDNHLFCANSIVTHNCRLKNMVTTKEFNFTNGNMGIQTGSKSVISLNLNRIVQDYIRTTENPDAHDWKNGDIDRYLLKSYLVSILDRVYKYHTAYNELLWDMYNAGLLPVYKAGFIDLNKQYLTIGLNGLNQAAEFLGLTCDNNKSYASFCQYIFDIIKEQNQAHKTKKTTFNTEQVPAESLAIKNYNWDKEDGYWVPEDTNLYASYIFKPNDGHVSILDKITMHGANYIGEYLDGGAAAHLNLDSHLSYEQYWKILNFAAEKGCQYFTFNVPNSECDDCGYITKVPIDKCPRCGSGEISYYDRVIGYLTKISNWSDGRQKEQKARIYEKVKEEI